MTDMTTQRLLAHRVHQWSQQVTRLRVVVIALLDSVIVLYTVALGVALVTGGIDLGWLSIAETSKPLLVLLILLPIRLAVRQTWWLTERANRAWAALTPSWTALTARVPAAVRDVAFALLVSRLAIVVVALFMNLLFPPARPRSWAMPFTRNQLFEIFAAWDSGWYFDIARRGYYYGEDGQSSVAFFPLYPLTMRAVAWLFGSSERAVWGAGVAISFVAALAALLVLHRLTERLFHDRETARRTVLYLAIFPFSFFLGTVYPTALFLLLTTLAVSAAYGSRWWLAGLVAGLTTVTRPNGILIGIPLGLLALRGASLDQVAYRLMALAPIPLSLLAYSLYVDSLAGDPLAWLHSQSEWGYSLGRAPWKGLLTLMQALESKGLEGYVASSEFAPFRLFHGTVALLVLMITPAVFKRLGAPLGAYVLVSVLVPLTSNALEGIGRYATGLFPVFMVLGSLRQPRLHEAILIVWPMFLVLFLGLFVTWHPIY